MTDAVTNAGAAPAESGGGIWPMIKRAVVEVFSRRLVHYGIAAVMGLTAAFFGLGGEQGDQQGNGHRGSVGYFLGTALGNALKSFFGGPTAG